ncbi:MAG: Zn-ribbon domain-containing OB-fold protein [Nitrososphaerales archaeon]
MPSPKKFKKFRDVMDEIKKSGAAIYLDPAGAEDLVILSKYQINYVHSYAEDSKFFLGLTNGKLLGSVCKKCKRKYGTPRGHCMECGTETNWLELPLVGKVHSWTTCYFGSEEFLKETPFNLAVVEFEGIDTLFLSRLKGVKQQDIYTGMKVRANFREDPKFLVSDVYFTPEGMVEK